MFDSSEVIEDSPRGQKCCWNHCPHASQNFSICLFPALFLLWHYTLPALVPPPDVPLEPLPPLSSIFCMRSPFPVSAPLHVSIRLSPPYILYSLPCSALLPFTRFASDSLRQPLPAWVKSSGPAGRAKPGACFPSERLLFAHSGN